MELDPEFGYRLLARQTKRDQDNAAVIAGTAIRCPRCDMVSHNPNDVREGYCGNCHDWTSERQPSG